MFKCLLYTKKLSVNATGIRKQLHNMLLYKSLIHNKKVHTFIPKCSVIPLPCSPRTPKERLSSKNILTLYLYFNFI